MFRLRRELLMVLLIVIAAGILIWRWHGARAPSNAKFADALFAREPVTLTPRIHMLGRLVPSVAYAIETSAGLVLVDTGLESDGSRLREQLVSLELDESRICAILLTHVHGDHSLGARFLRELTGVKIYAGRGDCQPLRDGGPREAFFSTFPMDDVPIHGTPVDVELIGDEELVFGDARIQVIATPGHTPGSICYLLHQDNQRVLFGGDTISSLISDLGTYAAYLAPRYRGNARDYLDSLRKLRAIPAPDLVLPGHPNEEGQPHSPRLSESAWHNLLDRGIRDMEKLVARFDADGEDFLDGNPKQLLAGLYYLGDYKRRAVFVLNTGSHQMLFDAPGDDGLAAFIAERLKTAGIEAPSLTAVLVTSSDPAAIGGLAMITATWDCRVVADASAHQTIRAKSSVPVQLMTPQELAEAGWFSIRAIPLEGCGAGTVAYLFRWENRDVLASGNVPTTFGQESLDDLQNTLQGEWIDSHRCRDSLSQLRERRPDLWLPAYPKNGQNANLYDSQWGDVLHRNLQGLNR